MLSFPELSDDCALVDSCDTSDLSFAVTFALVDSCDTSDLSFAFAMSDSFNTSDLSFAFAMSDSFNTSDLSFAFAMSDSCASCAFCFIIVSPFALACLSNSVDFSVALSFKCAFIRDVTEVCVVPFLPPCIYFFFYVFFIVF